MKRMVMYPFLLKRGFVAGLLLLSTGVEAVVVPAGRYEFRCHDPEGQIVIDLQTGRIEKTFRDSKPSDGQGSETISTVLIGCEGLAKGLSCIREGLDPLRGEEQTHEFPVSMRLRPGTSHIYDQEIRVAPFHRGASGRWATEIAVTPPPEYANPYTLYVEDRRGLVAIRFKSLVALVNHTRQVERRFDDVMCDAVPGQPFMAAGVRLMK